MLTYKLLGMVFVTFFSILLFSNIITALSTFFLSRELDRLVAAPVSLRQLFYARLAETVIDSSWDAARGPGLLRRRRRAAAGRRAAARARGVGEHGNAVLKATPGIKGWVTIGGYSALDSAKLSNVITVFAIYQDWDKRPPALSQMSIIADLQERFAAIRKATFAVLPPSPIPGLGVAFGFQMMVEDRASNGLAELQKMVDGDPAHGAGQARLPAHQLHHLQRPEPAALSSTSTAPWPSRSACRSTTSSRPCRPISARPT